MTTPMIMERVAVQSAAGNTQTMKLVYPAGVHDVYVYLGAGVFDVIVTWGGSAALTVHHRWDGSWASLRNHPLIPEGTGSRAAVVQRRGMVRVGSEHAGQSLYFSTSGALDETARATIQIIPASFAL